VGSVVIPLSHAWFSNDFAAIASECECVPWPQTWQLGIGELKMA
jgi:hypothetical protein